MFVELFFLYAMLLFFQPDDYPDAQIDYKQRYKGLKKKLRLLVYVSCNTLLDHHYYNTSWCIPNHKRM